MFMLNKISESESESSIQHYCTHYYACTLVKLVMNMTVFKTISSLGYTLS